MLRNTAFVLTSKSCFVCLSDRVRVPLASGNADPVASIMLPPSLFANISRVNVGLFFALYRTSVLFPVRNMTGVVDGRNTIVGSSIIAATVGPGLFFENLAEPVVVNLTIPTVIDGNVSSPVIPYTYQIH